MRAGVLVAIVASLVFLALNEPASVAAIPPCPSAALLGVTCPGCGSLRAAHHALNGRLATAFRFNPALLLLGVPALGFVLAGLLGWRAPAPRRLAPKLAWTLLVTLLAYFVARNVPALDWLRPPPGPPHR